MDDIKLANSKIREHLSKNAFTLIELLAIIVILAIIAVITIPIILNVIDNSKRGAAVDSAYGYKDSISKWYVTKLSSDSNYNIPDGDYKIGELGEQVEGQKPDSDLSWFKVTNNEVTEGCLQFDEYKVEISSGKVGDAVKGKCPSNEYVSLTGEVLDNIASYFSNDIDRTVYYNPISGEMNCNSYVSNNSKPGFNGIVTGENSTKTEDDQTSCLKWYKYSTNTDGSINMILDHNTEVGTPYYTSLDNSYGPANLMDYLTLSDWSGVPTRSDKYIAYVDNSGTKTPKFTNATDNAVNYAGKKARLITAQEIAEITGASSTISWNEQTTSFTGFYLDSKNPSTARTSETPSEYYWLFENLYDCVSYGCSLIGVNSYTQPGNSVETGNNGYWTSSPYADNSNGAYEVTKNGILNCYWLSLNVNGVRPVITVSNT